MQTCRHADSDADSDADMQTCRHADSDGDMQTCRHADMQTYFFKLYVFRFLKGAPVALPGLCRRITSKEE